VAAHELRTPVQAIIGLADTLYSNAQDIRQKDALEIIFRNARRLQRLVEDILDVTKIESDSLNLNRERFNLEKVIEDAINDMSNSREFQFSGSSSSRKRVKIVFDGTIRAKRHNGVIVAADKGRTYQVIPNLLSNAVKFTEKGVIVVSVNTRRTNGNRSQQQEEVIILVKDTGIGIHPEMVSRLFSKFASKSFEGTGLGLFISKRIIEAHGGRIWAVNNSDKDKEKAKGATFGFSLPLSLL